jgi:hypothetical protein
MRMICNKKDFWCLVLHLTMFSHCKRESQPALVANLNVYYAPWQ